VSWLPSPVGHGGALCGQRPVRLTDPTCARQRIRHGPWHDDDLHAGRLVRRDQRRLARAGQGEPDGVAEHAQGVSEEAKIEADLDVAAIVVARQRAGDGGIVAEAVRRGDALRERCSPGKWSRSPSTSRTKAPRAPEIARPRPALRQACDFGRYDAHAGRRCSTLFAGAQGGERRDRRHDQRQALGSSHAAARAVPHGRPGRADLGRSSSLAPGGSADASAPFSHNQEYHLKIAPGDHLKTWKTWINLLEII
jgi:hypothetical protein